jgi:hypothetical protein
MGLTECICSHIAKPFFVNRYKAIGLQRKALFIVRHLAATLQMKYLIPALFFLLAFQKAQSQDLVPFREEPLWGYKNLQGKVAIEPQYQYCSRFMFNVAIVAKNDSLGAIDKNNNTVLPVKYQFLRPLDSTEFLFGNRAVYFGEYDLGVITSAQRVKVAPGYRSIIKSKGLYLVVKQTDSVLRKNPGGAGLRAVNSYYGLLDSNGRTLIPCIYRHLEWKNDSLLVATAVGTEFRQALFTRNGKQLTGFEYMVLGDFYDGLAKARKGDRYGFINPEGKVAIPVRFEYCENFKDGNALIRQGNCWGAIDRAGKIVIEPRLEYSEVKGQLKNK